jgi:hypothetical protein
VFRPLCSFQAKHQLSVDILVDEGSRLAQSAGVAFEAPEALRKHLGATLNIDLAAVNAGGSLVRPVSLSERVFLNRVDQLDPSSLALLSTVCDAHIPSAEKSRAGGSVNTVADPRSLAMQALPLPAVFVVGGDRKVLWRHVDADDTCRPDASALLEPLQCLSQ